MYSHSTASEYSLSYFCQKHSSLLKVIIATLTCSLLQKKSDFLLSMLLMGDFQAQAAQFLAACSRIQHTLTSATQNLYTSILISHTPHSPSPL